MRKNLLVAAVVSVALAFSLAAQAGEGRSKKLELKSLPEEVQKTIREKAAGGEIVRLHREDDRNGRWNYEVVVKSNGKEWGFEVDPSGKFVKKHDDHKKTE